LYRFFDPRSAGISIKTFVVPMDLRVNKKDTSSHAFAGADPGFQVRGGAHLKKSRRAEGGSNIFGVFRVKTHDFTQKKSYFFQFWGGGGRAGCAPPPGSAPDLSGNFILKRTNLLVFYMFITDFHQKLKCS